MSEVCEAGIKKGEGGGVIDFVIRKGRGEKREEGGASLWNTREGGKWMEPKHRETERCPRSPITRGVGEERERLNEALPPLLGGEEAIVTPMRKKKKGAPNLKRKAPEKEKPLKKKTATSYQSTRREEIFSCKVNRERKKKGKGK